MQSVRKNIGFTLVELLVVTALLGIIASLAIVRSLVSIKRTLMTRSQPLQLITSAPHLLTMYIPRHLLQAPRLT